MANDVFNAEFTEIIPDGAAGNQAYRGIFYQDRDGLFRRLTQAEGHEIALNPETVEKNLIGMKAPSTSLRSYNESFDKDIVIEKKDPNFEFFNRFRKFGYTGANAEIRMVMGDFMESTPQIVGGQPTGKQIYLARSYTVTVQINTENNTDGILGVGFTQKGDSVLGIITYDEDTETCVFTPSTDIDITSIDLSLDEVEIAVGKEQWVTVDFSPFGAPNTFTQVSSDPLVCSVTAKQDSVIIKGLATGTATVTVKDAATESITATIEVIVS